MGTTDNILSRMYTSYVHKSSKIFLGRVGLYFGVKERKKKKRSTHAKNGYPPLNNIDCVTGRAHEILIHNFIACYTASLNSVTVTRTSARTCCFTLTQHTQTNEDKNENGFFLLYVCMHVFLSLPCPQLTTA